MCFPCVVTYRYVTSPRGIVLKLETISMLTTNGFRFHHWNLLFMTQHMFSKTWDMSCHHSAIEEGLYRATWVRMGVRFTFFVSRECLVQLSPSVKDRGCLCLCIGDEVYIILWWECLVFIWWAFCVRCFFSFFSPVLWLNGEKPFACVDVFIDFERDWIALFFSFWDMWGDSKVCN